jgi:hypothetical protein
MGSQRYQDAVQDEWTGETVVYSRGSKSYYPSLQTQENAYLKFLSALDGDDLALIRSAGGLGFNPELVTARLQGKLQTLGLKVDDGRWFVSATMEDGKRLRLFVTGNVEADRAEAESAFSLELAKRVFNRLDSWDGSTHPAGAPYFSSERDYMERELKIPALCFEIASQPADSAVAEFDASKVWDTVVTKVKGVVESARAE